MKKFLRKAKMASVIFAKGFARQMEGSIWLATGIGLYQGLKYGGSLDRGIKAAASVLGACGAATGVLDVMANKDRIDRA